MKIKGRTLAGVLIAAVAALILGLPTSGHARAAVQSGRAAGSVLELTGVTCKGASFCVATGYYATDARKPEHPPILDRWNGRDWRAIPQPRRGILDMNSFQCTGPSFCLASRTLLGPPISTDEVAWNGRSWRTINLRSPAGVQNLTCLSATFCVGWGSTDSGRVVSRWNGKSWLGMPVSTDGCGGPNCQYRGLICASETNCMLRGLYCGDETCEDEFNYVEAWNGTAWKQTTNPPLGFGDDFGFGLRQVTCAGRSFCMNLSLVSPISAAISRDWGHNWHDASANLAAVCQSVSGCGSGLVPLKANCASSRFCMTTIITAPFGPTLRWNGTNWKALPLASFGGRDRQLTGLSCGSSSNCAVIGTYQPAKGGPLRAFAEHWNGLAWKVTTLPQS